jgi:ABC-type transport system involved in cytochrome bd biosynthesis fused ATPase/permease subunit
VGIAIAIAAQGGSSSLNGIGLGDLAILGSALPTFVGLAQNAHETWLLTLRFRPMASILAVAPAKKGGTEVLPDDASRVVFTDVAFRYPAASGNAVEGVSVQFELGEPLVLTGPNGSGKSTLLRLLAGLALPTTGRIDIGGKSFAELDLAALRSSVAYLPQQSHLPEGMSVEDAIRMFVPTVSVADMRSALDRVGVLASLQGRDADNPLRVRIGLLSVGQRKRVALARVLLKDARLVLLDEPDANLDAEGVEMVARLMHDLARTRLVAIAAHTEKLVASRGVHVRLAA